MCPTISSRTMHIEWHSIAAMRDRLIHHYFGVDYEIVWDAVTSNVPKLREDLEKLIDDQANDE